MRILFFCRTSKTKLMVHLARILQENGQLTSASAFVAYYDEWRDYLRNQKEVKFDKIYGTKEIFNRMGNDNLDYSCLERMEKEYGDKEIWNIVYNESYLAALGHYKIYNHPKYSDEDVLHYFQICTQVAESIFDEIRPDCIIDFAPVGIFRGAFDLVAQKRKIPYLNISTIILANRFYISSCVYEKYEPILKTYHRLLEERAHCEEGWHYLQQFRETNQSSIYAFHPLAAKDQSTKNRNLLKSSFNTTSRLILQPLRYAKSVMGEIGLRLTARVNPEVRYNFQLYKNLPSIKLRRSILRLARKTALSFRSPFQDTSSPKDYAFMTLHIQPEASTSVRAPFFVNERYVIENVARALPLHWRLVIKPHLRMIGKEPLSFYRHIKNIPNVELVSPTANTRELITNSKAVVTVAGTSGFEASLLGKKAIVFGKPVWSMIHGVTKCTDFTRLHSLLREAESYEPDDNNIAAYLQAVHENSFSLKENYIWKGPYVLSDPGYREAINEVARQFVKGYQAYQENNT